MFCLATAKILTVFFISGWKWGSAQTEYSLPESFISAAAWYSPSDIGETQEARKTQNAKSCTQVRWIIWNPYLMLRLDEEAIMHTFIRATLCSLQQADLSMASRSGQPMSSHGERMLPLNPAQYLQRLGHSIELSAAMPRLTGEAPRRRTEISRRLGPATGVAIPRTPWVRAAVAVGNWDSDDDTPVGNTAAAGYWLLVVSPASAAAGGPGADDTSPAAGRPTPRAHARERSNFFNIFLFFIFFCTQLAFPFMGFLGPHNVRPMFNEVVMLWTSSRPISTTYYPSYSLETNWIGKGVFEEYWKEPCQIWSFKFYIFFNQWI